MKFLILEPGFPPESASGHLTLEFAEELVRRGNVVTVVTMFPRKYLISSSIKIPKKRFSYWASVNGIRVLRVWPQFTSKSTNSRLIEYVLCPLVIFIGSLFAGKNDIVQYPSDPVFLLLFGSILGSLNRSRKLVRVQDIHPDALVKFGLIKNKLLITVLEFIERFGYFSADHITVIAEGYKLNLLSKRVAPEKVSVLPNSADIKGIDLAHARSNYEFRQAFGLEGKFIVTYAGALSWINDLETIIESANLLKELKDVVFVFCGDGIRKEPAMRMSKNLNLDNTLFIQRQTLEKYLKILSESDVCVVSLRKDFVSPALPARIPSILACAKSIIANAPFGSDTYHLIKKANCGLWVESGDASSLAAAVLKLYRDRRLTEMFGFNGRKYAESNFSIVSCMDRYEELLNSFVKAER